MDLGGYGILKSLEELYSVYPPVGCDSVCHNELGMLSVQDTRLLFYAIYSLSYVWKEAKIHNSVIYRQF